MSQSDARHMRRARASLADLRGLRDDVQGLREGLASIVNFALLVDQSLSWVQDGAGHTSAVALRLAARIATLPARSARLEAAVGISGEATP